MKEATVTMQDIDEVLHQGRMGVRRLALALTTKIHHPSPITNWGYTCNPFQPTTNHEPPQAGEHP